MKTNLIFLAGVLVASALTASAADPSAEGKGTLYHVVTLKFKDSATPEQIRQVEEAFVGLKTKVPGVTSLHWGTNVSPEHRNKGFTHCFILTFANDKDRDAYLTHPAHKDFGKVLGPILDEVLVLDFWSKE